MRLNDAVIENMFDADNSDVASVREFVKCLKSSKLMADVYFNDYKAFTSPLRLTEDSGYLTASIDGKFSFDPAVVLDSILIRAHYINNEEVLFQSYTNYLSFPIELGDYDADLSFTVMPTEVANRLKPSTAKSRLEWLKTNRFKSLNLSEQDPANEDVEPDEPADPSDPIPESSNAIGNYPEENPTLYVESVTPSDAGEGWVYISNILDDESLGENEVGLNIMICGLGGQEEILCNVRKVYSVEFPDSISAADINSLTDPDRNVKVSDVVVFSGQLNKEDLPEGYAEINIGLRLPEVEEP